MPGRTSVRANRNSAASTTSRKSSAHTPKSRSGSTRNSTHSVQIPDEGSSTPLREKISRIFADAQKGIATQRKLAVTLRKVQETCCYESEKPQKHTLDEEYGEAEFNEEVARCVLRILAIKKIEPVGDRLVQFLGIFLKVASDRGTFRSHLTHLNERLTS